MSKAVTMRDIAKELNISVVSVSKALSDRDGVSDSVRKMIKDKALEMGYLYVAPGTDQKESKTVGVIVSHSYISDNAFYSKLYQILVMEFARINYSCILEIINDKDEVEGNLPNVVLSGKVDGLVVLGPMLKGMLHTISMTSIPCIYLDTYSTDNNEDAVVSDNLYGSQLVTNYLIAKGYKNIAFVGSIVATNSIMDRYLGYYKSLLKHQMAVREDYLIPDRSTDGNIFSEFVLPAKMPDAFVCNCDETAYKLMQYLKSKGYSIPEDVAVVGYDDYIWATVCNPQLTTFRVDMEAMGKATSELMEQKLTHKEIGTGRKVISGEIVIRDSVGDKRKKEYKEIM